MRNKYGKYKHGTGSYSFPYITPSAAMKSLRYEDSSVAAVIGEMGHTSLLEEYEHKASDNTEKFGCANCLGIEALKSCVALWDAFQSAGLVLTLNGDMAANLNALRQAYGTIFGRGFGECGNDAFYARGLRLNDRPYNPLSSTLYSVLRQNQGQINARQLPNKERFKSVTKQSAHAHAVISRKSLEIGVRYGLCEYLAAPTGIVDLRQEATVLNQSLELAGGHVQANTLVPMWSAIKRKLELIGSSTYEGFWEFQAARAILSGLIEQICNIAGSQHAAEQIAGLCTLSRRLVLSLSASRRRHAPDAKDYVTSLIKGNKESLILGCARGENNLNLCVYDVLSINNDLGKYGGDVGLKLIRSKLGLSWTTEGSVEFGKQCGLCEDSQGSADLSRRALDYYATHDFRLGCNPYYGITYSDLSIDDPGSNTMWDLSSSVVCQAIVVFFRNIYAEYGKSKVDSDKDFLLTLIYHCNNTPSFFVVYFEILFLELAFSDADQQRRRIVKLLEQKS
ncbi:hypothetical protein [Sorangium sp. So ce1024]|uniref:hypothetical protein n=1 Tax=Sorangium sp. So ce1024 TaxID=3133327 RepID=UPI003F05A562